MWKRKKKECQHKYKDFDWYIISNYYIDSHILKVRIMEPYVCIFCGNRIDKELHAYKTVCNREEIDEKVNTFIKPYQSKLKERAFVEDEINDFILVDKDYIEAYILVNNK